MSRAYFSRVIAVAMICCLFCPIHCIKHFVTKFSGNSRWGNLSNEKADGIIIFQMLSSANAVTGRDMLCVKTGAFIRITYNATAVNSSLRLPFLMTSVSSGNSTTCLV